MRFRSLINRGVKIELYVWFSYSNFKRIVELIIHINLIKDKKNPKRS